MRERRALRLRLALLPALALSSLPLIFLASDNKPASLNLPPFEKELYLSVTAKWAPNDCVDVAVVTNLPEGTLFVLGMQTRYKREKLDPVLPIDTIFSFNKKLPVIVTAPRIDLQNLFCGMFKAHGEGNFSYTNGLLIAAAVSATSFWATQNEGQELRIGHNGALLKGPLARPYLDEGTPKTNAVSETFVLKPLPLLPGEDEEERPIGWYEYKARELGGDRTPLPPGASEEIEPDDEADVDGE